MKLAISKTNILGYVTTSEPNLDNVCENAQCTEIFADGVLDLIPVMHLQNVLAHWKTKLRHSGRLIVGGTDIVELAKAIVTKRVNIPTTNILLFGEKQDKTSIYTLDDIVHILQSLDLKITRKCLQGFKFLIEARRE